LKPKVLIRLSKRFLVVAALIILIIGSSVAIIPVRAPSGSKIVYVAICVDTETSGFGGIGSTDPHPTLNVSDYSRTFPLTVAAVFDSTFRNSHQDSFGNIFKMSWFAEMDYLIAQSNFVWANGSSAGVSGYTAIRDLLVNNWGTEIQTYGDSIEYHHHFMIYDGTWKPYDNGPDAGYPGYQMYALDHMIIDRNFYPSSWRSGNWIMPPALSSWLEQRMPFDYTARTGIWYPVHPSGMDRWQTKCPYSPNVYASTQEAFAYASANGSAVYSICTHDNEDMKGQVAWLQWCLNHWDADETTYPNVSFKYVSAREAMQLALGLTDLTPPTFTVTPSSGTYIIVSSEPLWKNHPYIALRYADGTYAHMSATPTGVDNTWTVTPPTQLNSEENVARSSSVSASSYESSHPPELAIDGIESTENYWQSNPGGGLPQWLQLDLGSPVSISKIWTHFFDRDDSRTYTYHIDASLDGSSWTTIVPSKTTTSLVTDTFTEGTYRYVRITVTDCSTPYKVAFITEIKFYHVTPIQLPPLETIGVAGSDLYGNPGTATFTQDQYVLTVDTVGSGSVTKSPDQATYASGTVVTLTATPTAGWSFSAWSGDVSGSVNPTTITMNGNKAVTATFTQNTYTLTVTTSGSGSVDLNNTGPYHYGDVVELTATPALGWSCSGWSGDLTGSANPTTILIDADKAVTATFTQNTYTLTVTILGSGSVDLNNSGPYHYGDIVGLTANPAAGWSFNHWNGDLIGSVNPTTILIDSNKAVTATFTQNTYTLTISTVGSGVVNLNNSGPYYYADVVELTAVPAAGWSFSGWSGALTGSVNPADLTITGNLTVTATFTQNTYTLSVGTLGGGSVNLNNSGPYYYGNIVELTAVPSIGWGFDHWGGDMVGSINPTTILIDGDKTVTATFTQNVYTLTVSTVGNGNVNLNNTGPYHYGDVVELTATPAAGWSFSTWSGSLTGSANPASLTITGDMSVTATFTQDAYSVSVTVLPSSAAGTVTPNPAGPYHYGDVVQLTATPAAGYSFSGWSSGLTGNPTSVTITGDTVVTAYFTQIEYTLTVSASPAEGGSVTKNPDLAHFHYNDVVQLTAISSAGYSFVGWSGGLSGNPASVTITGNMEVTAYFTQNEYSLTVTVAPSSAAGSVSASIPGPYHLNDIVTLTPTANLGYTFSSWSGDGINGAGNTRVVTISGNMSVTATFIQNTYTLTVTTVGSGSVNLNNNGPCYYGDIVELTAVPSTSWSFDHWGGDLSGSINPTTILMDGDKAVTTTFTQNVYTLTVTTTGSGSVSLDKSGPYHYGDVVELTAVPVTGWSFQSWSGELSGSVNPITILIDGNKAVTATFVQNAYTLTVSTLGIGSVVKVPDQASYHYGDVVELTAVPSTGWSFDHWSQDLTGSFNPATLTITGNMTVTAHFTENTYTLTVNVVGTGCSVSRDNNGPYHYNDVVHLTANAAVGWAFSQWSGALTGNANPAALTITGDMAVIATFAENLYNLTITVSSGGGSVSKSPDQATYTYGTIVTLTASPVAGWSFSHWSGDLSGSTSPAYLTIDGDKSVTATFTQNEYTLTISTSGSGTVSMDKSAPYHYGDVVQLTAVPAAGWSFSSWSDALTGSANPASLTITGDMSVTATFTQNTYRITVTQGANGVISPETIDVEYGSEKAFTITPGNGYHIFDVVVDAIPQGAVSSYLFRNVVANHTISASFAIEVYTPFSIVSNSTISELAFNSTSQVLSFTAGGPSGTTGFSNVTISKTLIADVSGLEVYLDGTKTSYVVSDLTTSWLIYITYQHSTHKIAMNFAPPPSARADYVPYIALAAILGFIVAFVLTVFARRRGKSSQSEARARS